MTPRIRRLSANIELGGVSRLYLPFSLLNKAILEAGG
jgi:hypothetical protein